MTPPGPFRPEAVAEAGGVGLYEEALSVLRPGLRWTGGALALLVAGGLAWSATVKVPEQVQGLGILLPAGGVVDVIADTDGRIQELLVRPGDAVEPGQPVATLDQPELRLQLSLAEAQHADALRQREALAEFHRRDTAATEAWRNARDTSLGQSLAFAEERLRMMQEREDSLRGLAAGALVPRDRALFARVEVFGVRDEIAKAQNERRQLVLDAHVRALQREREMLDADRRVDETGRQAEALRDRLARTGAVLSAYAGRVVEAKANEGQNLTRGAPVVTLKRPGPAGDAPVAIIYVSAQEGKRLTPGMRADVSPSNTQPEEYGYIAGTVTRVADVPASTAGMQRTLQNDQLVRTFSSQLGAPFEVEVALAEDPSTRSGLRWTAGRGPAFAIESGTLALVEVTVREVRLIGLALPAIRALLGEDDR